MWEKIGLLAAVIVPFFNAPLIVKIIRRRSSKDFSRLWAIGVWVCLALMAPSGFTSEDVVWKYYNIINFVMFSAVTVCVLIYHKGNNDKH